MRTPKRFDLKQITVAIPPVTSHTRRILHGIARYAAEIQQWAFEYRVWDAHYHPSAFDGSEGILFLVRWSGALDVVIQTGLPAVNVGATPEAAMDMPAVYADHAAVSRLVAREYIDRGYEHLAFIGELRRAFASQRLQVFDDYARRHRRRPHHYDITETHLTRESVMNIGHWIGNLPKPVGVFVQNDEKAQVVLDACRYCHLRVPEDVAVIGVDDDEVLCQLTTPMLSSVRLDSNTMGYEAARMLDELLTTGKLKRRTQTVAPLSITTRQSSDIFAIDDPHIVDALQFIRDHAIEGIDIRDVLQRVPVSRRWLELQFARTLGRTPAEELRRVRIDHAKMLLRNAALSILDVALRSGYATQSTFAVSFKREVGCSPSTYRREKAGK